MLAEAFVMTNVHWYRIYAISFVFGCAVFFAWLMSPNNSSAALTLTQQSEPSVDIELLEEPISVVVDGIDHRARENTGGVEAPVLDEVEVPATPVAPGPVDHTPEKLPESAPADGETSAEKGDFFYSFSIDGVLVSTPSMMQSSSPYFWVTSGGKLLIQNGLGSTMRGAAAEKDPARIQYARVNPLDTGGGAYPQNTFRLVTKRAWGAGEMSARFRVLAHNETETPNRDGYSGLFLMNRYSDQHNLYYAGLRSDGKAVIKKKINGIYHTLAIARVLGDERSYGASKKSLIPINRWMEIASRVTDTESGVLIELFLDLGSGEPVRVLAVEDGGIGGPVFKKGHGGIRTDYMDAEFDDFSFTPL